MSLIIETPRKRIDVMWYVLLSSRVEAKKYEGEKTFVGDLV